MIIYDGPLDCLCNVVKTKEGATSYSSRGDVTNYNIEEEIISFLKNNINKKDMEYMFLFKGMIFGTDYMGDTYYASYHNKPRKMNEILRDDDKIRVFVKGKNHKDTHFFDKKQESIGFLVNIEDIQTAKKIFESSRDFKSIKAFRGKTLIKFMERD